MILGSKATKSIGQWSVVDLSAFYRENRSEFVAHATRILKDKSRAEEVVQDALVRVMLASPELNSQEHAIRYLHRTIENLCTDIFRLEGRRPKLVLLDDHTAEIEANWMFQEGMDELISAADDAAIVRQALSMLSQAERSALVMWEIEGRSSKEIANELGIRESSVRHTVSRARASLRRILAEHIVDKDRGLTALDLMSNTYKRVAATSKKSSKAVLSIILLFSAVLGFNSMSPSSLSKSAENQNDTSNVSDFPAVSMPKPVSNLNAFDEITSPSRSSVAPRSAAPSVENAKSGVIAFPGLDKSGVPTSFTVADSSGSMGSLFITNRPPVLSETELSISQVAKTDSGAANVFLSQKVSSSSSGLSFEASLAYGKGGTWVPLVSSLKLTDFERLLSGNYLVTAILKVDSEVETPVVIPASASGRDLPRAPKQVLVRLVLDSSKTQILAQAVYVVEQGSK